MMIMDNNNDNMIPIKTHNFQQSFSIICFLFHPSVSRSMAKSLFPIPGAPRLKKAQLRSWWFNSSRPYDQWLFLVPLKGGRWWHSPSPNWQEKYHLYTTYSPCRTWGVICYLPPFRGTRNNHWYDVCFVKIWDSHFLKANFIIPKKNRWL